MEKPEMIARLVEMLPVEDQELVLAIVKKLVLAWDPDFVKVSPNEAERIRTAEQSGYVADAEVDWDRLPATDPKS